MRRYVTNAGIIGFAMMCVACNATPQADDNAIPAILVAADASSHVKLLDAAASLMQTDVTLADDAFTASPEVILSTSRLLGRDMGTPERLLLTRDARGCVLVRPSTDQQRVIDGIKCKAAP